LFDLDGKLIRAFSGKSESHFANFLKAVRSRAVSDLNADILEGHQSTALCHIGNISYRLGHVASPHEIQEELRQLKACDVAQEPLERTLKHLAENSVDLEKPNPTLGLSLKLDLSREKFVDNPAADAFLAREYRKPFVVPAETEI